MIECRPKAVRRGSIQFWPSTLKEIHDIIGEHNTDNHKGQSLVNTKRHGWQNVSYGDYLVFDENNVLLKVLRETDYKNYYEEC